MLSRVKNSLMNTTKPKTYQIMEPYPNRENKL